MVENNFVSKYLLEQEIKRYEKNPELMKSNPMFYYMCQKELLLIEKIQLSTLDFRGAISDVEEQFKEYIIFIEKPEIINEMIKKAKWYDGVHKAIEEENERNY